MRDRLWNKKEEEVLKKRGNDRVGTKEWARSKNGKRGAYSTPPSYLTPPLHSILLHPSLVS